MTDVSLELVANRLEDVSDLLIELKRLQESTEADPHAELRKQYAKDAETMDKPWLKWEFMPANELPEHWYPCLEPLNWNVSTKYRRISDEPKLICGYTKEQWQMVIDNGWLVQVRDGLNEAWDEDCYHLVGLEDDWFIVPDSHRKYCRIHPSQPHPNNGVKPDWLVEGDLIAVRFKDTGKVRVSCEYYEAILNDDPNITVWQKVSV